MHDEVLPERETMDCDIVIVGAGPAGLAAAIRLKQIDANVSVIVLEKGAEVGAHILSGAVIDPIGIDKLLPDWKDDRNHPLVTTVKEDRLYFLTSQRSIPLPKAALPRLMSNKGNYIVSLADVCRWLAKKAEQLGVDIFPGFAVTDVIIGKNGEVTGVITGDMGRKKDGSPGANFVRGMALRAKYVLIAEGARGSLAKQLIARYQLDRDCQPAKFGIGMKELWEIDPDRHRAGLVEHSIGWPLRHRTGGGSFIYHLANNLVSVGYVVHLDYRNPYLSPFAEFQRFKTHPAVRSTFVGGKRIGYGARVIAEGGYQSVPKLSFPGGALIGCSAGLVNLPRLKGSHNAILSGMSAAEVVMGALAQGRENDELCLIDQLWRGGLIGKDLYRVRNVKPLLARYGMKAGTFLGGLDMWSQQLFNVSPFGTLKHRKADFQCLEAAVKFKPINYPKPDQQVSFDLLSSLVLTGTHHAHDEPCHLVVNSLVLQRESEFGVFGGPSSRYCPAGVYEWVKTGDQYQFIINAENCIHCKTCDIKDPNQNITWTCPQGGEGPVYSNM